MCLRLAGMAVLVLCLAPTLSRAQDKAPEPPVERSDLNRRIVNTAFETATLGTEIFNKKEYDGCFRLYQGTLMALHPLLDNRPNLAKSVKMKMDQAKTQKPEDGAFTLRLALDEIMNDIAPQPKAGTPKTTTVPEAKSTLWDRLGGTEGVRKIVDLVILKAVEDPKVKLFRDKKLDIKAIEALKQGMRDWVSSVTGGPYKYVGKDMKTAHAGMKITDEEFSAFASIIEETLKSQKVAPADIVEFMKTVEKTRPDIVTVKSKG